MIRSDLSRLFTIVRQREKDFAGERGIICVGQHVHTYRMLLYTVPIYAADRSCKSLVALLPVAIAIE